MRSGGEARNQEAKKMAEKVKRQAELSEKAEGSQDLVKDKVTVRKAERSTDIEQVGEASSYGRGFHGKKAATGEKFDQMIELRPIRPYLWERRQL